MSPSSYQEAGVNIRQGEAFVERIQALSAQHGFPRRPKGAGGYAAIYPVTPEQWVALTTDGVGTKLLLASNHEDYHTIGIDLVAMCANDLICVGATPTAFLDYYATGELQMPQATALIEGILAGCQASGMELVGGETAEMPDVYPHGHFDVAGFAMGRLTPDAALLGEYIHPGQQVIGVASSGIHSNGLSLARKILPVETQKAMLMIPTQLYVQPVLQIRSDFPQAVTGISHITGGGWRNLLRLNPAIGFEITNPLPVSPVFEHMMATGLGLEEAYQTFNMGMGLALTVHSHAEQIVKCFTQAGLLAQVVGRVTSQSGQLVLPMQQLCLTHR